jgi:hypothetical protein
LADNPYVAQATRTASPETTNLSRKALEIEKQCLCWRPERDAGQVLFSMPLGRGRASSLGSASFFVALVMPIFQNTDQRNWFAIGVVAGASSALVLSCCLFSVVLALVTEKKPQSSKVQAEVPKSKSREKWWEGRTLIDAKMKDWSNADYQTKLATAAELTRRRLKMTHVADYEYENIIGPKATRLVTALDTWNERGHINNAAITDAARLMFDAWELLEKLSREIDDRDRR